MCTCSIFVIVVFFCFFFSVGSISFYRNLNLEYLDLYLVHFPLSVKPGEPEFPFKKEDLLPTFDIHSVWEAMEECQKLGLVKSIGTSNFSIKKIELLLSKANIPPAVNQVSFLIFVQQICYSPNIEPN